MSPPKNRSAKRGGRLNIDAPFDQAIKAALNVKPHEKAPRKPRRKRAEARLELLPARALFVALAGADERDRPEDVAGDPGEEDSLGGLIERKGQGGQSRTLGWVCEVDTSVVLMRYETDRTPVGELRGHPLAL